MRLQILSDLHVDVAAPRLVSLAPGVDLVVVAGDVCQGSERAFGVLREIFPAPIPIVTVLGNHTFYRRCLPDEFVEARDAAPRFGITLLENDAVVIEGVRFAGCTLWTDYALFGVMFVPVAMMAARSGLNDHRRISWSKKPWLRFRPDEALSLHRTSREFLAQALAVPFAGPTVVVTHHAPHRGSLAPRFAQDLLSAAYVSDLSNLIDHGRPDLWVHGHTHETFDYRVGATRIVCNPNGYGTENSRFDAAMVVEV